MEIVLDKRAVRQIRLSAQDAIEEGDTETLREDILEAFTEEQVEEIERRLDSGDFFEFLTDMLDEWSGDDVDELFELIDAQLGAIRTIGVSPFKDGKVEAVQGDTFYAVIEYGTPQRAEVLLNYGNWSRKGSKHIDDQLPLASKKQMRPMWRDRKDIEANLESRKVFN